MPRRPRLFLFAVFFSIVTLASCVSSFHSEPEVLATDCVTGPSLTLPALKPLALPALKPNLPLSPREELATFKVAKGFRVELVAAEPDVIDPVAMTFAEDGRLYVMEMRGYPNAGLGEGKPVLPGRIKCLEDADGDGVFEKCSTFIDNLRFPTGLCCWRGGLIVCNAPDILYCKDTNGDGRADVRHVLYTGFGIRNIQQLVNTPQFHFDNWIHACNGANDSSIRPVMDLNGIAPPALFVPIDLRARHLRFRPDKLGSLEPMSGGGQYGLAADNGGSWFTCTNAQHLRHIVLPDRYIRRNPDLPVSAVVLDIPDRVDEHGPPAKVFRISPYEPWRLERTAQRKEGPTANKFPPTELFAGGFITSACGTLIYRGGLFPKLYDGNAFVCDPANNLIHRDVLEANGPTYTARRHDKNCEFLASTDIWFRPVFLCPGPEGAIYVADFYREVIETPLSLPDDIKKKYNLESRARGRIWRIIPDTAPQKPGQATALSKAANDALVARLDSANAWQRLTAQRLLLERNAADAAPAILKLTQAERETTRIHALWLLDGLGKLSIDRIEKALGDAHPLVREQALILSEPHLKASQSLRDAVLRLVKDDSPRVRFQLAFTLGEMPAGARAAKALAELARRDGGNVWMQTAILTSAQPHAAALLEELTTGEAAPPAMLGRVAGMVTAKQDPAALDRLLASATKGEGSPTLQQLTIVEGLAQALSRRGTPLAARALKTDELGGQLLRFFDRSAVLAVDAAAPLPTRQASVRTLAYGPFGHAEGALRKLLTPQTPPELQVAAIQAIALFDDAKATDMLLASWNAFGPNVRREVQEVLFARPARIVALLAAIEKGDIAAANIDLARREQLLRHGRADIRDKAKKLFAGLATPERKKIVEDYERALKLEADAERGRAAFKKHCATCHRLENVGTEVGPDLLSALKTKTRDVLLIDILDPSREVDSRFVNYLAEDRKGKQYTGLIASESASSVTLRRAEGAEDVLLRKDIFQLASTSKSLMPDGLEKNMNDQEIADVIAYLIAAVNRK
jgi:putative membrane-bound dehydrogenase-like protein